MNLNNINKSLKIALLGGGISAERQVSLSSAQSVCQALQDLGFQVTNIDPKNQEQLQQLITDNFDLAYIALHGKGGEDGTIQGFLETINLIYTGSGIHSSATCIDKIKSKQVFDSCNINTPKSIYLYNKSQFSISEVDKNIGYPCVVKAASEGSTVGIYLVNNSTELNKAVENAFELDKNILIEKFISGKEYTVGVLGNSNPQALPVIEIIPKNGFYDYEAKYAEGGSIHICPAEIDSVSTKELQDMAINAHIALNCKGISRSDMIRDDKGKFWLLEVNTVPGMTKTSLVPDAAKVAGISFQELCLKIIAYALENKKG